jgi:hypothetical protein
MKLILERDCGDKFGITVEGEATLETMQGLCVLLDDWAKERDKDNGKADR